MALSLHQVLRQSQRLIMTPQMQQSIQLLQLSSMELEQMIHTEMMENPFLELSDDEENLASQREDKDAEAEAPAEPETGLSEQAASEHDFSADDWGTPDPGERTAPAEPTPDNPDATPSEFEGKDGAEDFEAFSQNDVDWKEEYSDSDTIGGNSGSYEEHEDHDFTTYTALAESLYDSLVRQLRLSVLEGREYEIGEFLIGNLDENGFLDASLENQCRLVGYPPDLVDLKAPTESADHLVKLLIRLHGPADAEHYRQLKRKQLVASVVAALIKRTPDEVMAMTRHDWLLCLIARRLKKRFRDVADTPPEDLLLECLAYRLKADPQQVFDVLEVIHEFEPTGIGARSLAECLRLQCEERGIRNPLLYRILDHHLADLQQKRFREIAREIECPEADVVEVFETIAKLEPRPGRSQSKDRPRYITPDVYVKKVDDKYMYFLNEGDAGKLRVASNYRRLLANRARRGQQAQDANGEALSEAAQNQAAYAHEKYKNAVWLIKNIEKRKSTVLRVTEAIMNYQKDFLEKGIEFLHPLTLSKIAEVVGMHESTIARVTTGKYVETPRGIFELKFFFSSGLETDSGEDASSRSIKEMITQMIEVEDTRKPLSDQKIADMLRDKGIQIARRTVAKYREQLKILPAKLRKQVN